MELPAASNEPIPPTTAFPTLVYQASPGGSGRRRPPPRVLTLLAFCTAAAGVLCLATAFAWYSLRPEINVGRVSSFSHVLLAWSSVPLGAIGALLALITLAWRGWGRWKQWAFFAAAVYWILFGIVLIAG